MVIATQNQVFRLTAATAGRPEACFEASAIACVAEGRTIDLIAVDAGGLVLLDRDGPLALPQSTPEPVTSLLILREHPLDVLVGGEGAHLYRLTREAVRPVQAFDALPCRSSWHTPRGGPPAVRSLADTPDGWVYADIHVGSIMRSVDRGESWRAVTPALHEDVHQVATCPAQPDRVYANTADGVYVSEDRGQTWQHRAKDTGCRYGRAVAVDPQDPDLLLATVSDGPHGEDVHGQLYCSEDAGRTWRHVCEGFPATTRQNINTFHMTFTPDRRAWAVVGCTLYVSHDRGKGWQESWAAPSPIAMIDACRQ